MSINPTAESQQVRTTRSSLNPAAPAFNYELSSQSQPRGGHNRPPSRGGNRQRQRGGKPAASNEPSAQEARPPSARGRGRGGRGRGRGGVQLGPSAFHTARRARGGAASAVWSADEASDVDMSPAFQPSTVPTASGYGEALADITLAMSALPDPVPVRRSASIQAQAVANPPNANLTHLLNFRFAPTTTQQTKPQRKPKKLPAFSKEQFVNATYNFVLTTGFSEECLYDPDHPVEWTAVQQVYYLVDNPKQQCPICLDPPVAAKLTKCGHIFCYSCILHYLSLSDRAWSRCPLCFEPVYHKALKSLVYLPYKSPAPGEKAELILVKRSKDALTPYAYDDVPSIKHTAKRATYSRITYTNDITDITRRETEEIVAALGRTQGDDTSQMYLSVALEEVDKRQKEWKAAHPDPLYPSSTSSSSSAPSSLSSSVLDAVSSASVPAKTSSEKKKQGIRQLTSAAAPAGPSPARSQAQGQSGAPLSEKAWTAKPSGSTKPSVLDESAFPSLSSSASASSAPPSSTEAKTETTVSIVDEKPPYTLGKHAKSDSAENTFFYYQSAAGQHLYLHSHNYRELKQEFHTEENFPCLLNVPLLDIDPFVQTEQMRKKYRFLSHLPVGSLFAIGLFDLKGVTSDEMQKKFAAELRVLTQRRARKLKKAAEAAKKMEALAAASPEYDYSEPYDPGFYVEPEIEHESITQFPLLQAETVPASADAPASSSSSSRPAERKTHGWSSIAGRGFASTELWAPLSTLASSSPSQGPVRSSPSLPSQMSPLTRAHSAPTPAGVPPLALANNATVTTPQRPGAWGRTIPATTATTSSPAHGPVEAPQGPSETFLGSEPIEPVTVGKGKHKKHVLFSSASQQRTR